MRLQALLRALRFKESAISDFIYSVVQDVNSLAWGWAMIIILFGTHIVAATAKTKNPVRQSLVSASATFWDTVVVCFMTGLVVATTIIKYPDLNAGEIRSGSVLTTIVFAQIPYFGPTVLVGGIITFAYSTFLGWIYYGARCVEYFAGKKGIILYRILYIALAFAASVIFLDFLMVVADTFNALMALPNIVAIFLLSPLIAKKTKKYINNLDAEDPASIPVVPIGVFRKKKKEAQAV